MAERELTPDERVSVARAVKLVRKANKAKADLLNDMQQQGNIVADGELPADVYGRNHKGDTGDPKTNKITLNPKKVALLNGAIPLAENSPEILKLAGTLLHEADHAQCHDEMACFGAEVDFYETINREFDKYFPGVAGPAKDKIEKLKAAMEKEANAVYERIARKGGAGYGKDHKKAYYSVPTPRFQSGSISSPLEQSVMMQLIPDEPATEVTQHLRKIALLIYAYFDRTGGFPATGNAPMTAKLRELDPHAFGQAEVNDVGVVVDPWGRPYVYKSPGDWYPDDFDLYSLGPGGRDEGGGGDNILCELHRR
jgi:hypothetical protein